MTNSAMPQLMADFLLFLEQKVSWVSIPEVVITQISWSRVNAMRSRSVPPSFGSFRPPGDPLSIFGELQLELGLELTFAGVPVPVARGEVSGPETDTKLKLAVSAFCDTPAYGGRLRLEARPWSTGRAGCGLTLPSCRSEKKKES